MDIEAMRGGYTTGSCATARHEGGLDGIAIGRVSLPCDGD